VGGADAPALNPARIFPNQEALNRPTIIPAPPNWRIRTRLAIRAASSGLKLSRAYCWKRNLWLAAGNVDNLRLLVFPCVSRRKLRAVEELCKTQAQKTALEAAFA